ncbi:neprilysin-2 [Dendroctonus ponderosae]|uniref:neprilysin-2 n=1 Tax=Dendroctonus ponderosae TaxID=77166 RepID=UPI002034E572|nr:neprilysin-2 [Dendroctonus ponderosae]
MEQMEFEEVDSRPRRRVPVFYQKRYLCAMLLFSIVLAYTTVHLIATKSRSGKASEGVCNTTECARVAAHIQNFVNRSADPCEDFYKFACGNLHKNFTRNDSNLITAQQSDIHTWLYKIMVDKKIDETTKLPDNFKTLQKFFSTCMKIRNAEGTNMAFLNAVEYITGGWPKDFENVKHQSWWDLMLKSREMGMQFDFFLDVNIAEFPHAYLQIGPPELNKFRFYNKMWDIPQTVVYIEDIARHWGHTESSLFFENDGTLEFAKKLRDLVESCYKNSCVTIPKVATKISNLEKSRDSDSDWLPFLTNLTGIEDLNENDLVYFKMETNPKDNYISKLNELLESTPTRHWLNYIIIYHVVRNYQYLSTQFQFYVSEMGFEFLEESSDRQEFCLSEIGKYYRKDVEQGANHLVTDEEEQQIRTMYNYTHKALTERLRIEFKDNKSLREGSLKLLKNIRLYIGASEHFFEDDPFSDALANKSEELSDNAIEMIHNLERKRMDHIFGLIRKPKGNYSRILEIGANTFTYSVDDSL